MKAFVVVATKGRPKETFVLLDCLARQTLKATHIVVVGSEPSDVEGLEQHPLYISHAVSILNSPVAGLTIQRNVGLDTLKQYVDSLSTYEWFAAFFDDDYRPANNWLEVAANALDERRDLVGITGHVLADGVGTEFGISETNAQQYLLRTKPAMPHWTNADEIRFLEGLYGCNMAFRGNVAANVRFDEHLPLYGWQEDYDFASRARQFGGVALWPECKGVHLGTSLARTSGVRFGYSQIANPIYLAKKGTMSWRKASTLMSKNMLANIAKTFLGVRIKDFPGRLRGNFRAWLHFLLGKLDPLRVLDI